MSTEKYLYISINGKKTISLLLLCVRKGIRYEWYFYKVDVKRADIFFRSRN